MLPRVAGFCWVAFLCGLLLGQPQDKSLRFDVASVKPAAPLVTDGRGRIMLPGPSGGPGTKDPGRIHYPNMSLKLLLMNAYDVKSFQISGPPWLDTERFDINATMPPETTKEQFRVMLQNLLVDRFKMAIHRETKELPAYTLELARGGSKLKEAETIPPPDSDGTPLPLPTQPKIGPDGFPILPFLRGRGGVFMVMMPTRARLIGQDATIPDLVSRLTDQLSRPVIDATGLTGKYDFTLTFSHEGLNGPMGPGAPSGLPAAAVPVPPPQAVAGDSDTLPDIFAALQSQLGLKLNAKKASVALIVIDHAEKTATEN